MDFATVVKEIRGDRTQAEFGKLIDSSNAAVSRYESGERPPNRVISALLRVTTPEQHAAILGALGVEDPMQFARDILASAGVVYIEVKGTIPAAAPATDGKEQEQ